MSTFNEILSLARKYANRGASAWSAASYAVKHFGADGWMFERVHCVLCEEGYK